MNKPQRSYRKKTKTRLKLSTIAIYASVFVLMVVLVGIGYRTPESQAGGDTSVASATPSAPQTPAASTTDAASVNDVVATSIAATVATSTNLSVASSVSSMATSAQISSALSQATDQTTISKPSIVQPNSNSTSVTTYVTQAGDTVTSVAAKYGLQAQTIEWANNLVSDALSPGTTLKILPVDGVLYTVKSGDTLASIASKYQSDATRITLDNDLTTDQVTPGAQLVLPGGVLPKTEQPGYVAPVTHPSTAGIAWGGTTYGGNGYAFGNCTYYAYNRRIQLGLAVGSNWGNASTWAVAAESTPGFVVNHTPSVGAIAQWNAYAGSSGWAGHVGIVESINGDGTITISEMNYYGVSGGGFNRVDRRTIAPSSVSNFIH